MYINSFLLLILSIIIEVLILKKIYKDDISLPANILRTRSIYVIMLSLILFFINTSVIELMLNGKHHLSTRTYYGGISLFLMYPLTERLIIESKKIIYFVHSKKK